MGTFLDEKDGNKGQNMTEKTETQEPASKGIFISASKPLDLGSVDSDLFSAILSGDVEFVRSRFRGNDRMSDAEAILMIRTRRAEEEKVYAKEFAASQFETAQEDPSKKVGAAFFGGMTYDAYMRNQSRPDNGETRQGVQEADLFGGYVMGGSYRDAYGGTYDQYGYEYANGNYKTIAGDLFDMAKGTITLATGGAVIPLMAGLEKQGAGVLKISVQIGDAVENALAELEQEAAPMVSLAGSILTNKGADDIKPSANAVGSGSPSATGSAAAMATTTGVSAIAMETAAPAAAAAVAKTVNPLDMNNAFEMDEASRAAASFEEGGALGRMGYKRGLKEHEVRLGQIFIFENIQKGMTPEEASNLTEHQHKHIKKMIREEASKHNGNVMENMTTPEKMMMSSTAISATRQAIYSGTAESIQEAIGKIVGTPQAGSVALNLGKKPAAFRP